MSDVLIDTIQSIQQNWRRRGRTRAPYVAALELSTPDGRCWSLSADPGTMLFQLFEVDRKTGKSEEHDPVEACGWTLSEVLKYLEAIGS